jgi:hypothetical protein
MEGLRHNFFSGSVPARDQNVRVGRTDSRDRVEHRLHRWRRGNEIRTRAVAEQHVLRFQALRRLQRTM